jgi:hypothetical protein
MTTWKPIAESVDRPEMRVWSRAQLDLETVPPNRKTANNHLTRHARRAMCQDYRKGASLRDLAEKYRCSKQTAIRVLDEYAVKRRHR